VDPENEVAVFRPRRGGGGALGGVDLTCGAAAAGGVVDFEAAADLAAVVWVPAGCYGGIDALEGGVELWCWGVAVLSLTPRMRGRKVAWCSTGWGIFLPGRPQYYSLLRPPESEGTGGFECSSASRRRRWGVSRARRCLRSSTLALPSSYQLMHLHIYLDGAKAHHALRLLHESPHLPRLRSIQTSE
jgi:hypothetical protein